MHIETERLILRNAKITDAEPYHRMWNCLFSLKYNVMNPPTYEQALANVQRDAASENAIYLERKVDGQFVGTIHLGEDSLRYDANSLMLDYCLLEEFSRQGYMTEALSAAVPYAFEVLGAQILSARVFLANKASLGLLKKLGFTQEGILRQAVRAYGDIVYDDVLFSLLRMEYKSLQK